MKAAEPCPKCGHQPFVWDAMACSDDPATLEFIAECTNMDCEFSVGGSINATHAIEEWDFAQIKGNGSIDISIAKFSLEALSVDAHGLDEMDNKILNTIIDKFKGGPVGITTIATAVSESPETIEEVYEPFLIQQGFIMRTPRGREVTEAAYKHLGKVKEPTQGGLF